MESTKTWTILPNITEVSVAAAFFAETACSILIETARALAGTGWPRRVCQVQEIGVDIVHFSAESALIGRWPETFLWILM